jgi:hypothetical protein
MRKPNPRCTECGGTGWGGYEYCGAKHAYRCGTCFPPIYCPDCKALWYSKANHHPGCPKMGTIAPENLERAK